MKSVGESGKIRGMILLWSLLCMLGALASAMHTEAKVPEVIRVGYYPLEGYHAEDEEGIVRGYEAEYLSRVADITGWKYEYVKADSWEEAVRMLREGTIDLLSPAEINRDNAEGFSFSASNIGKSYAVVLVRDNCTECKYEEFAALKGLKFGLCTQEEYKNRFKDYCVDNGFLPDITMYGTQEELDEALWAGEVDAIVTNMMQAKDEMRVVGKFGVAAYYFMFRTEARVLEKQLNEALLYMDNNLESELNSRYFPISNRREYTKKEAELIGQIGVLNVGCPVNLDPVSYWNEETGELEGITRDVLDKIAKGSGLRFNYVPLPVKTITYEYLVINGIDLVSCVEYNMLNTNLMNLKLTDAYLTSQKVIVGRRGESFHKDSEMKLSLVTGSETFINVAREVYPEAQFTVYDSIEECLDAVASGREDAMIQNQYTVERLLSRPKYEELTVLPMEGIKDTLTLALITEEGMSEEDSGLLMILNKALYNISNETVSEIVVEQTAKRAYKFTINDFFYRYRYTITLLLMVSILGVVVILYKDRQRRSSMRMLKTSENKLQSIADNINGGVVVLLPAEGMPILYVNEGFLKLIQYSREEFDALKEKNYAMYVDSGDAAKLLGCARANCTEGSRTSLTLKLQRKDGSRIPTIYNGTISRDENGKLVLYGVVVDVSGETSIMNKLQLEQRKHSLIIEKSEEIIYEIDVEHSEMKVSDAFERRFGWTFSKNITASDIDDMLGEWRVYEEDFPQLQKMFRTSLYSHDDVNCQVRIMDAEGRARWCEISQYVMTDHNNRNLWFIGKIKDIDEEIRERERLEARTLHDIVTGLYNKAAFLLMGQEYLDKCRKKQPVVLFMDLDNFKNVNDTLGHIMGDKAIADAARKLQDIFPRDAIVSRFGGDEYCVLIKDIDRETLEKKLEQTVICMRETYSDGTSNVWVSTSIGVVEVSRFGSNLKELLKHADKALYHVKNSGKNNYYILQGEPE